MADEADSKSVVGNHVWVQVPSPAVIDVDLIVLRNYKVFSFVADHEQRQVFFMSAIRNRKLLKILKENEND